MPGMPLYEFSVRIGDDEAIRSVTHEAADPDAAWVIARATVEASLAEAFDPALLRAVLVVTDAEGEIVFEFPFSEAITPPSGPPLH